MSRWLVAVLSCGGAVLAGLSAAALVLVRFMAPMPIAGATLGSNTALVTLYWILLIAGSVAAIVGFVGWWRRK
jgi:hypothetical protein